MKKRRLSRCLVLATLSTQLATPAYSFVPSSGVAIRIRNLIHSAYQMIADTTSHSRFKHHVIGEALSSRPGAPTGTNLKITSAQIQEIRRTYIDFLNTHNLKEPEGQKNLNEIRLIAAKAQEVLNELKAKGNEVALSKIELEAIDFFNQDEATLIAATSQTGGTPTPVKLLRMVVAVSEINNTVKASSSAVAVRSVDSANVNVYELIMNMASNGKLTNIFSATDVEKKKILEGAIGRGLNDEEFKALTKKSDPAEIYSLADQIIFTEFAIDAKNNVHPAVQDLARSLRSFITNPITGQIEIITDLKLGRQINTVTPLIAFDSKVVEHLEKSIAAKGFVEPSPEILARVAKLQRTFDEARELVQNVMAPAKSASARGQQTEDFIKDFKLQYPRMSAIVGQDASFNIVTERALATAFIRSAAEGLDEAKVSAFLDETTKYSDAELTPDALTLLLTKHGLAEEGQPSSKTQSIEAIARLFCVRGGCFSAQTNGGACKGAH